MAWMKLVPHHSVRYLDYKVNIYRFAICMCQRYFICAFAPCVLFLFSQAAFPSETDQLLAGVKKIYLHNLLERDQMMALLSVELTQKGYAIAGDISEADAVLKGTHETEIIIDDSPHPKETNSERTHSTYVYELIARNNKRLWKTSFMHETLDYFRPDCRYYVIGQRVKSRYGAACRSSESYVGKNWHEAVEQCLGDGALEFQSDSGRDIRLATTSAGFSRFCVSATARRCISCG